MNFQAIALVAALFVQGGKLDVKEVAPGAGRAAQANDIVTVEYTGTLTSGKEFDSSKGKAPLVFTLGTGQVIKGWDQGVVGMKVGGERELTIPPDLAYGDQGAGDVIPPKSTLKFDIKLLRIDRAGDKEDLEQKVTKEGSGAAATDGDLVDVHYTGTFLNGVKFDSSYDRKVPLHYTVGHTRLIKGFMQGLAGIKPGEKRHLVIPASLGYGGENRGPIPANSTLVFDVEAVKITTKADVLKAYLEDQKKLKIEDTAPGAGEAIKNGDVVQAHITATLADGKKLLSTKDGGQPANYQVGSEQLSRGFDAALIGMKAGGKRKVTVPPELGYGAAGAGNGLIPPNATLVFEIEIVKVNP